MKLDAYVKVLLTIIAGCLVVLTARSVTVLPQLRAAEPIACSGDMKPTSTPNAIQASLGASYRIEVTCR